MGFVVTNLPMGADWVIGFYSPRGTSEQYMREVKHNFRWTQLSCLYFRDNKLWPQFHALAYNLANFLSHEGLPVPMTKWSLSSLQIKLINIGAHVVRHARAITFHFAKVAVSGLKVRMAIAAIQRLRAPPVALGATQPETNPEILGSTSAPARWLEGLR